MTAVSLGFRITCDACGSSIDREVADESHAMESLRPSEWRTPGEARHIASTLGWTFLGYRRLDGEWPRYDYSSLQAIRHRKSHAGVLDVCPTCSKTWVPPYTQAAVMELNRREREATASVSDSERTSNIADLLAQLVSENRSLREALSRGTEVASS